MADDAEVLTSAAFVVIADLLQKKKNKRGCWTKKIYGNDFQPNLF